MSEDRTWVRLRDVIDARMNIDLAVAAGVMSLNLGLVPAERLSPEMAAFLTKDRTAMNLVMDDRLVICDRLLPVDEPEGVLADLSAILLLHDNDSSSRSMGRAA